MKRKTKSMTSCNPGRGCPGGEEVGSQPWSSLSRGEEGLNQQKLDGLARSGIIPWSQRTTGPVLRKKTLLIECEVLASFNLYPSPSPALASISLPPPIPENCYIFWYLCTLPRLIKHLFINIETQLGPL